MRLGRKGWVARVRSLGEAMLDLGGAEIQALKADFRRSAKGLQAGTIWLALGAFFGFWTVGALLLAAIEVVALWLPRWGAILVIAGVFGLAALAFFLAARGRFRKLDSPVQTVARRFESHSSWVRQQLISDDNKEADGQ